MNENNFLSPFSVALFFLFKFVENVQIMIQLNLTEKRDKSFFFHA